MASSLEKLGFNESEMQQVAALLDQLRREVDQDRTRPSSQEVINLLDQKIRDAQGSKLEDLNNLRAYLFDLLQAQKTVLTNQTRAQTQALSDTVQVKNDRIIRVSTPDRTNMYTDPTGKPTSATGTTVSGDTRIASTSVAGDVQKGKMLADDILSKKSNETTPASLDTTVGADKQPSPTDLDTAWDTLNKHLNDANKGSESLAGLTGLKKLYDAYIGATPSSEDTAKTAKDTLSNSLDELIQKGKKSIEDINTTSEDKKKLQIIVTDLQNLKEAVQTHFALAPTIQAIAEFAKTTVTVEELKKRIAHLSEATNEAERMMGRKMIFDWMRSQGLILLPQGESFQVLKKLSADAAPEERIDLLNTLTARGITVSDVKSYLIMSASSFDDMMQPYIENGKLLKTPNVETFINDLAKQWRLAMPLSIEAIKAHANITGTDRDILIAAATGAFDQDKKREITQEAELYMAQKDAFKEAENILQKYPSIMKVAGVTEADLSVQVGASGAKKREQGGDVTAGQLVVAAIGALFGLWVGKEGGFLLGLIGLLVGGMAGGVAGANMDEWIKAFKDKANEPRGGADASSEPQSKPAESKDATSDDILKYIDQKMNTVSDRDQAEKSMKEADMRAKGYNPPKSILDFDGHLSYLKTAAFLDKPAKDFVDRPAADRGLSIWGKSTRLASTTPDLLAPIHKNMVRLLLLGDPKAVSGNVVELTGDQEKAFKQKYWDTLTDSEKNTLTMKQLMEKVQKNP